MSESSLFNVRQKLKDAYEYSLKSGDLVVISQAKFEEILSELDHAVNISIDQFNDDEMHDDPDKFFNKSSKVDSDDDVSDSNVSDINMDVYNHASDAANSLSDSKTEISTNDSQSLNQVFGVPDSSSDTSEIPWSEDDDPMSMEDADSNVEFSNSNSLNAQDSLEDSYRSSDLDYLDSISQEPSSESQQDREKNESKSLDSTNVESSSNSQVSNSNVSDNDVSFPLNEVGDNSDNVSNSAGAVEDDDSVVDSANKNFDKMDSSDNDAVANLINNLSNSVSNDVSQKVPSSDISEDSDDIKFSNHQSSMADEDTNSLGSDDELYAKTNSNVSDSVN